MNRCALVLSACLVWPTSFAVAQNVLQNSALEISVRFDDETRVDQRIRTVEGARATIAVGAARPARERRYVETPMGIVAQDVAVAHEPIAAIEVVTRVIDGQVAVQVAGRSGKASVSGRVGEWLDLGTVATPEGPRKVRVRVDELR